MNARQRGTQKKSGSNTGTRKKASSPREAPKKVTQRDEELGKEIRALRDSREETQAVFVERLGISLQRLSAWENGEKPPIEALLQIATLALQSKKLPESKKIWFWMKAGVKPELVFDPLWRAHLSEREKAADEGAVLIPLKREPGGRLFALPSTRIPYPEKTICLQVPNGVRGVICSAGDLLVIDGSEAEPRRLLGCLVAASFSAKALNLRELAPGAHLERGRVISQKELKELELNWREDSPAMSGDEFLAKYGPKPGVRLGWLGIQCSIDPTRAIFEDKSSALLMEGLWRIVLQPAVVSGLDIASVDCLPIYLSSWQTEAFPLRGSLTSYVREGAQIDGRVIGWFCSQEALRTKAADLQEPK